MRSVENLSPLQEQMLLSSRQKVNKKYQIMKQVAGFEEDEEKAGNNGAVRASQSDSSNRWEMGSWGGGGCGRGEGVGVVGDLAGD